MTIDTEYLVAGLRNYFETDEMVAQMKALTQMPFVPSILPAFVADAVCLVEKIVRDAHEVGEGGIKRDAVVKFIDETIQVGWLLETVDGIAIGFAVDQVVEILNKKAEEWITFKEKS